MSLSRRGLLKMSLAAAAGCTTRGSVCCASSETGKTPIGLQLYAVRGEFSRNAPETLKTVAALGYQGVEFWGYAGTPNVYQEYSAQQLRRLLDDNGLKCCGMHLQLKAIDTSQLQMTIENNRILGNLFLNVASAKDMMGSKQSIEELAARLNEASRKCWPEKMRIGYHAHGFDFARIDGRFAWDILFSQTDPSVVMQMDVGNCLAGGGDPLAMLKKFPGRATTIHIRDYEDKTFDSQYYREVFQLCETQHQTQWYIVEAGGEGGHGFDVPRKAIEDLRRLGK